MGHPIRSSLLGRGGGWRWGWGFGRDFRRLDRIDLHGRQDLFQAVEDFVAVDVLGQAIFRSLLW